MKKYVLFIGIDISKHWIAVSVTTDGQKPGMPYAQFRNTSSGFAKMLKWVISQQTPSGALLFCMEHTGVYTLPLCYFLQQQGLDYILETALRIKKSLGLKTCLPTGREVNRIRPIPEILPVMLICFAMT